MAISRTAYWIICHSLIVLLAIPVFSEAALNTLPPGICEKEETKEKLLFSLTLWEGPYQKYLNSTVEDLANQGAKGDTKAYVAAALQIFRSDRTVHQINEALEYINKAAAQDEPLALYVDGTIKRRGLYVDKDYVSAHQSFVKSAEKGFPPAITSVAVDYLLGQGVEINFDRARELALQAVAAGDIGANQTLGVIYRDGFGLKADPIKAFEFFHIGALAGDPVSSSDLARSYYFGVGVQKNVQEAYVWAKRAYCGGVSLAGFLVGEELLSKSESSTNVNLAIRVLSGLADEGNGDACLAISDIYLSKKYHHKDPSKSLIYLRCAAQAGLVEGKYRYGAVLLRNGKSKDDYALAERMLEEAAAADNVDAQYDLGVAYLRGTELKGDEEKAHFWLKKAAALGSKDAAELLKK